MDNYLDEIGWQFLRFGLIFLAGLIALWLARRFRRWLGQRQGPAPKWAGISAFGLGLGVFIVLAVSFGFIVDMPADP